jgi:hypothetical protein
MTHILYAIYKNGEPVQRGVGVTRNAFDKKASAKAILTQLSFNEARKIAGENKISFYYHNEEFERVLEEVRNQYEIKEFKPV